MHDSRKCSGHLRRARRSFRRQAVSRHRFSDREEMGGALAAKECVRKRERDARARHRVAALPLSLL